MYKLILLILLPLITATLPSCESRTLSTPTAVTVNKDLVYATGLRRGEPVDWMLDLYAPLEAGDWPLVLYLHDFGETKEGATLLPQAIAEQGAIVLNIEYPHLDPSVAIVNHGRGHRILDEIVACAVRFGRSEAAELGSDKAPVALAGFAYGGGVASHVALMGDNIDELWQEFEDSHDGPPCECECKVSEGSTKVDALVGIAGNYEAFIGYEGEYGQDFIQEKDPALWELLHSAIGENRGLKVRLLHSEADDVVPFANSAAFEKELSAAGYDVDLIRFDGGHVVPVETAVEAVMGVLGK